MSHLVAEEEHEEGKSQKAKGKRKKRTTVCRSGLLVSFAFCLFPLPFPLSPFDGIIRIRFKGSPSQDSQPRATARSSPECEIDVRYQMSDARCERLDED